MIIDLRRHAPKVLIIAAGVGFLAWQFMKTKGPATGASSEGPIPVAAQVEPPDYPELAWAERVTAFGKVVPIRSVPVGDLVLPTGKLVAIDPFMMMGPAPLDVAFPPGKYPVTVRVLDEPKGFRPIFLRVDFGPRPITSWRVSGIKEPLTVINVDSGTIGFLDLQAVSSVSGDKLLEVMKNVEHVSHVVDDKSGANVVAISTGDGRFSVCVGFDAANAPMALVVQIEDVTKAP